MNNISKNNKNKLSSILKFGILGLGLSFSVSIFSMDYSTKRISNLSLKKLSGKNIANKLLSLPSKILYELIGGNIDFNDEINHSDMTSTIKAINKKNTKILSFKLKIRTFNHDSLVSSAVFSPNGKYILTKPYDPDDKIAKLWDIGTGKLKKTFYHKDYITSAVFSPDGEILIAGPYPGKIWNTKTGNLNNTFHHGWERYTLVFSPDGKSFLTSSGNTMKIWNTKTGILIETFQHDHEVNSAVFSPDG
ncbi:WD40 repeat domain-containing protein, partial [Candidatus Dependentiae bacterium]